jgi:uncharacterized membrane protein
MRQWTSLRRGQIIFIGVRHFHCVGWLSLWYLLTNEAKLNLQLQSTFSVLLYTKYKAVVSCMPRVTYCTGTCVFSIPLHLLRLNYLYMLWLINPKVAETPKFAATTIESKYCILSWVYSVHLHSWNISHLNTILMLFSYFLLDFPIELFSQEFNLFEYLYAFHASAIPSSYPGLWTRFLDSLP